MYPPRLWYPLVRRVGLGYMLGGEGAGDALLKSADGFFACCLRLGGEPARLKPLSCCSFGGVECEDKSSAHSSPGYTGWELFSVV